jgi:hypothetical protein
MLNWSRRYVLRACRISVLFVEHVAFLECVKRRRGQFCEHTNPELATYQVILTYGHSWNRWLRSNRAAVSKLLEIECGRAGEEKNTLVDERWLAHVKFAYVSTGLEHVRNGSELEAKQVAGFDVLADQVLAGGENTIEAISKKVHAPGCVLVTLKHCATPLATTAGHATQRTQQNTAASNACLAKNATGMWKSCADHVDHERTDLEG